MNAYTSLRKKNKNLFPAVAVLALCVLLSASMLFSRVVGYSAYKTQQYVPLTVSSGTTHVTAAQPRMAAPQPQVAAPQPRSASLTKLSAVPMAATQAESAQSQTTTGEGWIGITNLELFRVSYENENGEITVHSAGQDDVIAPGTSNSFTFSLQNTCEFGLDYDMEIEAFFSVEGGEKNIPVQLRLFDYSGKYLVGGPKDFVDLSRVNKVTGSGSISAGYIAPYTLEWQWPFEGNDAYDTSLGNYFAHAEEDVTFTIVIRTFAEQGGEGGVNVPNTGDQGIFLCAAALCGSSVALFLLIVPTRHKREDENAQA